MANKREKERRAKENLLNQYKESRDKILPMYLIAAIICAVSIFGYFFNWLYIYNSSPNVGTEIKVSGFSAVINALTLEKYTSANKVYGDMNVFYYFAKSYCVPFASVALIAFILTVISAVLCFFVFFTKKQELSFISVIFTIASAVLTIVSFAIAVDMKNSRILPEYCGGNPRCSIRSLAIIPALVMIVSAVVQGVAVVKFFILKRNNRDLC